MLAPSDYMPDRFYFANEMHMGGCGAISTTRNLGDEGKLDTSCFVSLYFIDLMITRYRYWKKPYVDVRK
jgi:hypothetical protein